MIDILIAIITPIIAAGMSSYITIIVLRTDMIWIKKEIDNHDKRIYNLETKKGFKVYGKN